MHALQLGTCFLPFDSEAMSLSVSDLLGFIRFCIFGFGIRPALAPSTCCSLDGTADADGRISAIICCFSFLRFLIVAFNTETCVIIS